MKVLWMYVFLSLAYLNIYAQKKLDSLKVELSQQIDQDIRLKILDQITFIYYDSANLSMYNHAKKYLDEGIKLSESSKNSFYRYVFLVRKAYLLKEANKYEEGLHVGEQGYYLALKHKDYNYVHRAGYILAMLYSDNNNYPEAHKQIVENIRMLKQYPNSHFIRSNYLLLSVLSKYVNNDLLYEYYLKKGNEYFKDFNLDYRFKYEFPIVKYLYVNNITGAKELLKEYLTNYPIRDLNHDQVFSYINVIKNFIARKEMDIAGDLVDQLLKLNFKDRTLEESLLLSYKVKIEINKGNYQLANSLNKIVLDNITPVNKNNILAMENQVHIDSHFGKIDEALDNSKKIFVLKDSILFNNNVLSYMMISTLEELDSLKVDHEKQLIENTYQKDKLNKLINLKWILYVLLFILLIICFVLLYYVKDLKFKKDKLELHEQILLDKIDKLSE